MMNYADELHSLFPTQIQISEIDRAEALNDDLERDIYEFMKPTPKSVPGASRYNLHTPIYSRVKMSRYGSFQRLEHTIHQEARRLAVSMDHDIETFPPHMTECWINIYGAGGAREAHVVYGGGDAQEIHLHQNNVMSGIYSVKAPESSGQLLLYSTLGDVMSWPPKIEITNLDDEANSPIAGQILPFQSPLQHSGRPRKSVEERISIAFNLTM